jgi:hypothetical protein
MAGVMVNEAVKRTAKAASSLVFIGYSPYLVYGYFTGHDRQCFSSVKMSRTTKQDTSRSIGEKKAFVRKPELKPAAIDNSSIYQIDRDA